MRIEAERAHSETWRGQLTGAQLAELLRERLIEEFGAPRYGTILVAHATPPRDRDELPAIEFVLVHDRDWFLKEPPASGAAS